MATYATKGNRLRDLTVPVKSINPVTNVASGAGLSPLIWDNCPLSAISVDPAVGYQIYDDFVDAGLTGTITTIISDAGAGRYLVFGSTGATIAPDYALGGGLILANDNTDNDAVSITTKQRPFQITSGGTDLWFEARVKFSTITTNKQAWICGLMDGTAQTATVPLTATGTIADVNFVGFHKPEANTTAFDASYKADGVTAVEVNSDIGTLAAATYIKLGMKYTTANNQLSFYVNGVKQTTSKTIPNATGTDFPADTLLAPVLGIVNAAGEVSTATIDWWKIVQLRA